MSVPPRLGTARLFDGLSRPQAVMPGKPQYLALWDGAKILLTYLLVPALLLTACVAALAGGESEDLPGSLRDVVEMMGYIMALGYIAKRLQKKKKLSPGKATGFRLRGYPKAFALLLALMGFCFGLFVSALLGLLPLPESVVGAYESGSMQHFTGSAAFMGVFIVGVFSPIAEELVFRGFLMQTLRRSFSDLSSIGLTALLFGLMHVQPVWMVYAALMGAVLGWVAVRFGNLLASILVHTGFNVAGLLVLAMPKGSVIERVTGFFPVLLLLALAGAAGAWLLTDRLLREYDAELRPPPGAAGEEQDGEASASGVTDKDDKE